LAHADEQSQIACQALAGGQPILIEAPLPEAPSIWTLQLARAARQGCPSPPRFAFRGSPLLGQSRAAAIIV